ncbi:TolC family protein [Natronoflexus pectinivorans]|uniref:Outer membrane protein TolC n=1 Tax=Natronoflexus pectinivorans TaxID=682526 RepID=A0A4R2GPA2_9BACT|nr:TolC family protein [Natronoflexus pectinivorans]TCO10897.1 outer membrane protein TolC [Natronoflexus pectinivorans]
MLLKKRCLLPVLLLAGFVVFNSHVFADEPQFSLEEALEFASKNAYQKISSNFDVESARRRIWETIADGLPQVELTGQYNHSIDMAKTLLPVEFFPQENWPSGAGPGDMIPVSFGTPYDANYGVGVTQLIFDGSYFVGVQATRVFLEFTEQQQRKTDIEIRNSVAQAYFLVLSARENQEAFSGLLEANEKLLLETQSMFEAGFVESLDVSQMELLVNNSRKQLMEVKRNKEVAMSVLKFTMGYDKHAEMRLSDSLTYLSQRIISGGIPDDLFVPDHHVDYQLAMTNEESQRLYLKNERAQYLPRISAFYNFQKIGFSNDWNVFTQDWYRAQFVGVQLSVPLFTSGMRHARVQQQKLSYKQSINEREMTLHNLQSNYVTARATMRNSYEQYLYSIENRRLALDILEKTRVKFTHGISSSSEYTQQQTQYIQAQMNYVQSAVNLMNAHIALLKATGQL